VALTDIKSFIFSIVTTTATQQLKKTNLIQIIIVYF